MNWVILIIAGFCETGFAFCLGKAKPAVGSEWWWWIAGFAFFYVLSAVLLGIFVFHEPATFWRLLFLSTLILSIVGLKIVG